MCPFPCRICDVPKDRLFDCNVDDIPYRDDSLVRDLLDGAWGTFCKSVKRFPGSNVRIPLSAREKGILNTCQSLSIYPIKPAMMRLMKPYPEYSMYESFPPDIMHTLIGGLMITWVSLVMVICAAISESREYRDQYRYNKANSKIVTFASGAYLVATRSIPRYDEILTPYGVKYKMISSMK